MIQKLGQVMLYVKNQENALKFWTEKIGFAFISTEDTGQGMKWHVIAPSKQAETSIVLHDRDFIAKMQPELNLETPSLLFYSDDFDKLYNDLKDKDVKVGEIVNMPMGRVFNFADEEDHYFAVAEKR